MPLPRSPQALEVAEDEGDAPDFLSAFKARAAASQIRQDSAKSVRICSMSPRPFVILCVARA